MNHQQPVAWNLLGEVYASVRDQAANIRGHRQRAVLALLLVNANKTVSTEEIENALWGENPPRTARNSVQRFVADVRRGLGEAAERLTTTAAGYRLEVHDGELDIDRARTKLRQGRICLGEGSTDQALALFEDGLAEFRGPPLDGIGDAELFGATIGALNELFDNLSCMRFEAALARGQHAVIADDLHRYADEHPTHERAWALYMLGLYRSGRQRDALSAAEQLRSRLTEEHGITPSPLIAKLVHQILNHADEIQLDSGTRNHREPLFSTPKHLPAQLQRTMTSPLVGRSRELTHANRAIERLQDGLPSVTFVAGEPGIGKTRLTAELASTALQAGSDVFYGRSDEDTALPLGAWAEALTHIARARGDAFDRVLHGPARESLASILPQLNPSQRQADDTTSETRRASLFQAIALLLDELSAQRPLTLVLDDLQWAEASTLHLVRHIARHATKPIWIIASYRDNELGQQHPLRDVVATLLREPHVRSEQLQGIDETALGELVQSLMPEVNEARMPDFARALWRETNGNPFFASEIVRDMIESAAGSAPSNWMQTLDRPLPDTVRQVVRQRVARLGSDASQALRKASVFGREFNLAEVALVTGVTADQLVAQLDTALEAAVVSELVGQPDRFAFAHDLMHHALYNDLSDSHRRRLHAKAAQAIVESVAAMDSADARASELAGHFLAAADPSAARQTIDSVTFAATVASRRHAPDEAASLLARALKLLDEPLFRAGLAEPAEATRLKMLVRRGRELRNAGDPTYREALLDAGNAANALGDIDAEVEAALANTRGIQTNVWDVDEERLAQFRRALDLLGDEDSIRRANLLASLASEQWADEDREGSQRLRAMSVELARRLGDDETLANVLARAARARNAGISASEFRELADEMYTMVDKSDSFDPHLTIKLLRAVQNQALRDADPHRLSEMGAAIKRLTERTQLPVCQRADILSDVLVAGIEGDGERYVQLADQALSLSLEIGDPESFIAYEGHYFFGLSMLGRADEVVQLANQVAQERTEDDIYQAIAANANYLVGDVTAARNIVEAGLTNGFRAAVDDYTVQGLQLWADAAAWTSQIEACTALYPLLAPHTGRLSGHVVLVTQPVDLSLGRLCHTLERYDDAFDHFDISDRICQAFNATWMQGMTNLSRASALLTRQEHGDKIQAEGLLASTIESAEEHNHPGIVALALERLR